jgi:hypothetical protein
VVSVVVVALVMSLLGVAQVATAPISARASATPPPVGTAGVFVPLQTRILDTDGTVGGYSTPMPPGTWRSVAVEGVGGIPADGVAAVQVTVATATVPTSAGQAFVASSDATGAPTVAALDYGVGATGVITSTTIVAVGADGQIKAQASSQMNLVMDVQGYYTAGNGSAAPGGSVPVTPQKVYDTRTGLGRPVGQLAVGTTYTFAIAGLAGVPANATAAFLQIVPVSHSSVGLRADASVPWW